MDHATPWKPTRKRHGNSNNGGGGGQEAAPQPEKEPVLGLIRVDHKINDLAAMDCIEFAVSRPCPVHFVSRITGLWITGAYVLFPSHLHRFVESIHACITQSNTSLPCFATWEVSRSKEAIASVVS
jgi:hypothetical protein